MDFLLAQGITETIEVKPPTETNKVEEKKEVQQPELPEVELIDKVISDPISLPSFAPPIVAPIRPLPMGTITETITLPATIPTSQKSSSPTQQRKMNTQGVKEEVKQEPSGNITIKREICDGEVHLGPFKSCLKEFTGVPAVGWVAAAAGLIVLWKWLDYRFKK